MMHNVYGMCMEVMQLVHVDYLSLTMPCARLRLVDCTSWKVGFHLHMCMCECVCMHVHVFTIYTI
ncbi:hypothetical protein EON63_09345 [archaeon]|nr:MAG: hypothetical protein EON63_09345 [archaeon]